MEKQQSPRPISTRSHSVAEKSRIDTAALASSPKTPFSVPFLRLWRRPSRWMLQLELLGNNIPPRMQRGWRGPASARTDGLQVIRLAFLLLLSFWNAGHWILDHGPRTMGNGVPGHGCSLRGHKPGRISSIRKYYVAGILACLLRGQGSWVEVSPL